MNGRVCRFISYSLGIDVDVAGGGAVWVVVDAAGDPVDAVVGAACFVAKADRAAADFICISFVFNSNMSFLYLATVMTFLPFVILHPSSENDSP